MNARFLLVVMALCVASLCYSQIIQWELMEPDGFQQPYNLNNSIKTDDEGNIYYVGYFEDSITVSGEVLHADGFYFDMLIMKYDQSQNLIWYKEINLSSNGEYFGFDIGINGDLYIASSKRDTLVVDDIILDPEDEKSGFVTKIDSNGNVLWVKRVFDGFPTFHNLNVSSNDDILIVGVSWNGGFFAKLDQSGNPIWKRDMQTPNGGSNVWGSDMLPAPDGSFYGVLMFQSERINVSDDLTLYNPYSFGNVQVVLFKFDDDGEILWYSQNKEGKLFDDTKLAVDDESNVYLIGSYANAPLQLGDLELEQPPGNIFSGFISKCTSGGQWEWLLSRNPHPNVSLNIEIDCKNEKIYSVGLNSLEVYSYNGTLDNQILFNYDYTQCHSLCLGTNDNMLISGITIDSLIGNGSLDWFNPFIASIDYSWSISDGDCGTSSSSISEEKLSLSIYPTIIENEINIEHKGAYFVNKVVVSDLNGVVHLAQDISLDPGGSITLNTKDFPQGILILTIHSEKNSLSKRIMKLN